MRRVSPAMPGAAEHAAGLGSMPRRALAHACLPRPTRLARPRPPPDAAQELLARARRRGFRVNLRPLADVRNLCWIPIAYFALLHGLRLLWWLAVAIASGPAEGGAGGAQRHYHHQQYEH